MLLIFLLENIKTTQNLSPRFNFNQIMSRRLDHLGLMTSKQNLRRTLSTTTLARVAMLAGKAGKHSFFSFLMGGIEVLKFRKKFQPSFNFYLHLKNNPRLHVYRQLWTMGYLGASYHLLVRSLSTTELLWNILHFKLKNLNRTQYHIPTYPCTCVFSNRFFSFHKDISCATGRLESHHKIHCFCIR